MNTYSIIFNWDNEACVWIATSNDVRGLVLEDESFDELIREVHLAVPALLDLNNAPNSDITLDFIARRQERVSL